LTDSFAVAISPEGIAVDVRQGNAAPIAFRDTINTNGMNPIVIDVQANDLDPNGDALVTEIISDVVWGNTLILNDDSIRYLAFANIEQIIDSAIYRVCDNGVPSRCDTAVLYIEVDNPVGVDENAALEGLRLYPNPVVDDLYLRIPMALNGTVTVRDAIGRIVFQQALRVGAGDHRIASLAGLPGGIYLVEVRSGDAVHTARLARP
ncbi:MAG: Ig-like domain-containing protein, partial [Bacteroidota bacterium]